MNRRLQGYSQGTGWLSVALVVWSGFWVLCFKAWLWWGTFINQLTIIIFRSGIDCGARRPWDISTLTPNLAVPLDYRYLGRKLRDSWKDSFHGYRDSPYIKTSFLALGPLVLYFYYTATPTQSLINASNHPVSRFQNFHLLNLETLSALFSFHISSLPTVSYRPSSEPASKPVNLQSLKHLFYFSCL